MLLCVCVCVCLRATVERVRPLRQLIRTIVLCDITLHLDSSTALLQSFEEKCQLVPVNLGDNDFSSEGNAMNEMAYSFNEDEFSAHKAPNTPVGRSKLYSRQSSMWPSSLSNGLSLSFSSWFERDGCSSSASSSSSFLPYCGNQSISSETNISRDNPRYSDPITHKMNSNSGMDGPSPLARRGMG